MNSNVTTKDDLIRTIFDLLDDNDAVQWDNDTAYSYLQRLTEYLSDTDIGAPTWRALVDALVVAKDDKK